MKTMFVYILKCSDNTYNTGVTNNLDRRFAEHQEGYDKKAYTFSRRPVELVFFESFIDANEAISFEKQVKKWSQKKKEAIIQNNWEKLKDYAACKNESSHNNYSGSR